MSVVRIGLRATCWALGTLVLATAWADDFRVENRVYLDGEDEPISATTTLFRGGQAYDFLHEPAEITIVDMAHRRVVLLDALRKWRLDLTFDEIEQFTKALERKMTNEGGKKLSYLVDPRFDEQFDEASGELLLENRLLSYQLWTTEPEAESAVERYVAFADWLVRLSPYVNQQAPAPFPRLAVNAALAQHGRLPKDVELTITSWTAFIPHRRTVRAEHEFEWGLLADDMRKIDEAGKLMAVFEPVSLNQYRDRALVEAARDE